MKSTILQYNVIIKKEGKDYIAHVPTLGISDYGKTVELAARHVEGAIHTHLAGLQKAGEDLPTPDTGEYYVRQVDIPVSGKFTFTG